MQTKRWLSNFTTMLHLLKNKYGLLFLIYSVIFSACNPDEEVPGYIHIDKINFTTDYTKEGSARANIVDAWVYVDNSLQGIYKLPATFPILQSGVHDVKIKGGIIVDGIETARAPYPLFTFYETSVNFSANVVKSITPSVRYYNDSDNNDGAVFSWLSDFETGISLDSSDYSTVNIHTTSDSALVYEGNRSGVITLDSAKDYANIVSHDKFVLPKAGATVYLELNYNTNNDFVIGLKDDQATELTILGLKDSKNTWKKLYLNLSTQVSSDLNAVNFQVFFKAAKSTSLTKANIYLDNIKLVHSKS
jgi:hypothetical protein